MKLLRATVVLLLTATAVHGAALREARINEIVQ